MPRAHILTSAHSRHQTAVRQVLKRRDIVWAMCLSAASGIIWAGEGLSGAGSVASASGMSAFALSADGANRVGIAGVTSARWTRDGGMETLGSPPVYQTSTATRTISHGDVIVGSAFGKTGRQALRWSAANGMVEFGYLQDASRNEAQSVSRDGSVVVSVSQNVQGNDEAFRWTSPGSMQGVGALDNAHFASEAKSVNVDGRVVVG